MRKDERFMENMNNATKVVTGEVRFSFLNVFEPKSINGSEEKYSVSLLFPRQTQKQSMPSTER